VINFEGIHGYARQVGWGPYLWRTFVRQFCKRILRRDLELRLPTGLTLHLPRNSHYASVVWLTQGHADEGCEEILLRSLHPEEDFLDIGAHLGYYSLWCAPRVRRVHAFEPDPRNHPWLQQNARRAANVVVNQAAVSDSAGEITLCQHPSSAESHVLTPRPGAESLHPLIRVPCTTIDIYWRQQGLPPVCAFKVDVEGHELPVLRGAVDMMNTCRPVGLIETTHQNKTGLCLMLESLRYKAVAAVRAGTAIKLMEMDGCFSEANDFTMVFLVPEEKYPVWSARSMASHGR
jgi:FkbM family methyltransferase